MCFRDKSYTPLYVSECGGQDELEMIDGREVHDEMGDVHPATGGAKNPLKRGASTPGSNGRRAIKQAKVGTPVEEAIAAVEKGQLQLDRERLMWEQERDREELRFRKEKQDSDMKFLRDKEENRHQEAKQKLDLLMKKVELQLAQLRGQNEGGSS